MFNPFTNLYYSNTVDLATGSFTALLNTYQTTRSNAQDINRHTRGLYICDHTV